MILKPCSVESKDSILRILSSLRDTEFSLLLQVWTVRKVGFASIMHKYSGFFSIYKHFYVPVRNFCWYKKIHVPEMSQNSFIEQVYTEGLLYRKQKCSKKEHNKLNSLLQNIDHE